MRLDRQIEIDGNARAHGHGDPQGPALALGKQGLAQRAPARHQKLPCSPHPKAAPPLRPSSRLIRPRREFKSLASDCDIGCWQAAPDATSVSVGGGSGYYARQRQAKTASANSLAPLIVRQARAVLSPPAMSIITRFAPSPTGFLHIGSARTALVNWL